MGICECIPRKHQSNNETSKKMIFEYSSFSRIKSTIKPSEVENVGQSETLKQTIKENVKILLF